MRRRNWVSYFWSFVMWCLKLRENKLWFTLKPINKMMMLCMSPFSLAAIVVLIAKFSIASIICNPLTAISSICVVIKDLLLSISAFHIRNYLRISIIDEVLLILTNSSRSCRIKQRLITTYITAWEVIYYQIRLVWVQLLGIVIICHISLQRFFYFSLSWLNKVPVQSWCDWCL